MNKSSWFCKFANSTSHIAGHPLTFGGAVLLIILWGISGPIFGYSDTWQLVINTTTTIVTFLMVFLIQNTQNRDSAAVQIKLDELIFATKAARNSLLDLEELDQKDMEKIRAHYEQMAKQARCEEDASEEDCDLDEEAANETEEAACQFPKTGTKAKSQSVQKPKPRRQSAK